MKSSLRSHSFFINGTEFGMNESENDESPIMIESVPRPYSVTFDSGPGLVERLLKIIQGETHPLLLIDEKIFDIYFSGPIGFGLPTFKVRAEEKNKGIETVLDIIDFLEERRASRTSMLFVIGGGILQDLGAFSAYMFKRGIPWTFVPTTLLAQGDSCVGGKTALNRRGTKNLLALFSAPRAIFIDSGFQATLTERDWLSGGGELLRLCITGGDHTLSIFENEVEGFLARDRASTFRIIRNALLVKKEVVEHDEFELDTRRSMNYGHSFGHALEALTQYSVPHGVGVTLGVLVENEISFLRGALSKSERDRMLLAGNRIISPESFEEFSRVNLAGLLALLRKDKKAEGTILKVATLSRIGCMEFIDVNLDESGEKEVIEAYSGVVSILSEIR